jgi:hypothetical protein
MYQGLSRKATTFQVLEIFSLPGLKQQAPVKSSSCSFQALKNVHAPQADAAGFGIDIAILLKVAALNIVAQGKTAIEAEWIIIADNISPERDKRRIVPNREEASFGQVAEYPGTDSFFYAVDVTAVMMP